MSERPDMPYEKAIEATAKTAGKAIDLIDKASPAIAHVYNWMIGDRVAEARIRNLDAFQRETERIIKERNLKEKQPLPENLAIPLLDTAQGEPREELRILLAALLANAMDPKFSGDVRPEFVTTIRQFQPIDASLLQHVLNAHRSKSMMRQEEIGTMMQDRRHTAIEISCQHLEKLGCIRFNQGSAMWQMTPFGLELMSACDPHPN